MDRQNERQREKGKGQMESKGRASTGGREWGEGGRCEEPKDGAQQEAGGGGEWREAKKKNQVQILEYQSGDNCRDLEENNHGLNYNSDRAHGYV